MARKFSLPECVALLEPDRIALFDKSFEQAGHPALAAFRDLAAKLGIWLHVGSLAVLCGEGRIANRTFLIDPRGSVTATYDKIHMFDVDLADGEAYQGSATYQPGDAAVIAELPWGRAGLTICYDVRFPGLYTHLAETGVKFIGVPSAFTGQREGPTGICCCGHGRLKPAAGFSPPRNTAITLEDVKPTVIRLSRRLTRGAKWLPTRAKNPATLLQISIPRGFQKRAGRCRR